VLTFVVELLVFWVKACQGLSLNQSNNFYPQYAKLLNKLC
jgi:hypothetical protein